MRRREFVTLIGGIAVGFTHAARAQKSGRTYRVGYLSAVDPRAEPYQWALVERLGELGFADGRNLRIELRTYGRRIDRVPALASELAQLNCDVLVAPGNELTLRAMKQASRDTPIVTIAVDFDLYATGHVDSLARPGGRITGVTNMQTDLPAKRIQLLAEILPQAKRIGVMADVSSAGQLEAARAAALQRGLSLRVFKFERVPYEYELAFAEFDRAKAQALLALGSAFFVEGRKKITTLALAHRLPSMFHHSVWAEAGGLASYGPSFADLWRRAGEQVAMILNGAKPAEMPVELPTRIELAINLKTAKAMQVTVPQKVLVLADRLIQ